MKKGNHETKCWHFDVNWQIKETSVTKFSSGIRVEFYCQQTAFSGYPYTVPDLTMNTHALNWKENGIRSVESRVEVWRNGL